MRTNKGTRKYFRLRRRKDSQFRPGLQSRRGDAALAQTFLTQSRRGRWGCGDTEGIAGSVVSRLRQAPSARLAPKNQGVSLRALPACAWHLSASRTRQAGADRRLCVSNCNTWVQYTRSQKRSPLPYRSHSRLVQSIRPTVIGLKALLRRFIPQPSSTRDPGCFGKRERPRPVPAGVFSPRTPRPRPPARAGSRSLPRPGRNS